MSQTITTKKLGELLQHWHESQSDPIYAVGSLLFAGKPVDEEQVKKTRDKIRKLLSSAERGSHGWGQDEVEELRKISDGLAGLLRVYEFGQMPTLDDFRGHLTRDRDPQGRRYISAGKPILRFDLTGDMGKAALDGASQADQDRAAAGKGRADITATQTGDKMTVAVNNIESLHSWIAALANMGPAGAKLAKTIMEDLGYSWTRQSNPAKRGGSKGGVMLNNAAGNIEKHLLQGDEVHGRARIGAPHGYFIRVFPYEGKYVFQVSQGASFSGVLQRETFSTSSEAAKHMSDVAAQGLTWHRAAKANPVHIFPEDLSSMSAREYRQAVSFFAKKSLKDLRRRQNLVRSQIQQAYAQKNTKALRDHQVMERVLTDAVMKREFGE